MMPTPETIWKILDQRMLTDPAQITAAILKNRGISGAKTVQGFLKPDDPYGIRIERTGISRPAVARALVRIRQAVQNAEQIVVYGDYDADGVCGTAVLWETLYRLGAKVAPFIPHRTEHGYGLNRKGIEAIEKAHPGGIRLIITVDNGIVAFDGAAYCRQKGIDLIITDHHQKKFEIRNSKFEINHFSAWKSGFWCGE